MRVCGGSGFDLVVASPYRYIIAIAIYIAAAAAAAPHPSPLTTLNLSRRRTQFLNNTAHSSFFGFRIYPSWTPLAVECTQHGSTEVAAPQFLVNSTFHHIADRGIYWKFSGSVHFVGSAFVSNGNFDIKVFVIQVPPGVAHIPHVQDSLFVCDPSGPSHCSAQRGSAIHLPASEDFYVSGSTFWNYGTSVAPFTTCNACDGVNMPLMNGGYTYRTERVSIVNWALWVVFGSPYKDIMWDLDGTLSNALTPAFVLPTWAYNRWPGCASAGAAYANGDVAHTVGMVCAGPGLTVRRIHFANPTTQATDYDSEFHTHRIYDEVVLNTASLYILFIPFKLLYTPILSIPVLNISSAAGWAAIQYRPALDWVGWAVPLVSNHGPYNFVSISNQREA